MDERWDEMGGAVKAVLLNKGSSRYDLARLEAAWDALRRLYLLVEDETPPESPVSLGEAPHDPADCFMYRGRPHLGACMDAEAYTRWYWLDGPGSRPFESTQIALATARLVAEAYQAKEGRLRREAEPKPPADTSWLQFDRERPDA